ncbi:MAG: alpha/beta hydrolase [Thermoleophilaceae bacterium]
MLEPERLDVPAAGGPLRVWRWPGDSPLVLAAHGITSNGLAWASVAEALAGEITLVAPDLRGRGDSRDLPGPYGMARHADDLMTVLDHLGAERAAVAGHSMGGFVAAVAAVRHPDRVAAAVLVDGGVAFDIPAGDPQAALEATLGPAMERLRMTFPDAAAYRAFWRQHPALAGAWSPAVEAHIDHDTVPAGGGTVRSACAIDAVREDGAAILTDDEATTAARRLPCPATLLWAPRGMLGEPPGLYTGGRLSAAGLDPERVVVEQVPGVNHYTVLLGGSGAAAVAGAIRAGASR